MRTRAIKNEQLEEFSDKLNKTSELVFRIGIDTGLRISDILNLEKSILEKKRFSVLEKKTKKRVKIYIKAKLKKDLIKYSENNNIYIFEGRNNKPLTRQGIYKQFKKVANEMNIQRISPHSTRKAYVQKEYSKTRDLQKTQEKIGHEHLSTTILYLFEE